MFYVGSRQNRSLVFAFVDFFPLLRWNESELSCLISLMNPSLFLLADISLEVNLDVDVDLEGEVQVHGYRRRTRKSIRPRV